MATVLAVGNESAFPKMAIRQFGRRVNERDSAEARRWSQMRRNESIAVGGNPTRLDVCPNAPYDMLCTAGRGLTIVGVSASPYVKAAEAVAKRNAISRFSDVAYGAVCVHHHRLEESYHRAHD